VLLIDTLEIAIPFTNVAFGAHVSFCVSFPNVLFIDTLEIELPFTNVACDIHVSKCVLFICHLPTWGISNTLGIFKFFFSFFFSFFF
jgi:hypothetical protein